MWSLHVLLGLHELFLGALVSPTVEKQEKLTLAFLDAFIKTFLTPSVLLPI